MARMKIIVFGTSRCSSRDLGAGLSSHVLVTESGGGAIWSALCAMTLCSFGNRVAQFLFDKWSRCFRCEFDEELTTEK